MSFILPTQTHPFDTPTKDTCNKLIFFIRFANWPKKKTDFPHGKPPCGEHALLYVKACNICTSYGI